MLRVVGADGKPLRVPLTALLNAAEARFATTAREDAKVGALWQEVNALIDRLKALEARPVVSVAGLATQSAVNTVASAQSVTAADVAELTVRVAKLESEIKLKKDK
jgi:hypothetical protein